MAKQTKESVFHKGVGVSKTETGYSIDLLEYSTEGFLKVTSLYTTTNHVDAFDRAKIILARDVRPI